MSSDNIKNVTKIRIIISLAAAITVGLTFLASGTGKILGLEEVPAQVVDFVTAIIPSIFLTPLTISFLYKIFIPHIVPWVEFVLGFLLIIGFMPRLISILCLPLLAAFMGTNIWSIVRGGYATCASCFGIWEKVFGSLTPVQSLIYDIVLFAFAIMGIFLYSGNFCSSQKWLVTFARKSKTAVEKMERAVHNWSSLSGIMATSTKGLVKAIKQRPRAAVGVGIGIGLILVIYGVTALYFGTGIVGRQDSNTEPVISSVSVSEVSENSAAISWITDRPTISRVQIFNEAGIFVAERIDKTLLTNHRILVDGLSPGTLYYLEIALDEMSASMTLSKQHNFTTQTVAIKLLISDVRIAEINESNVIITWTTSKPATSEVIYWVLGSLEKNIVSDNRFVVTHSMSLSASIPDAVYSFRVNSTDASGNQAVSEAERTFTLATGAEVGKRAPDFTLTSLDGTSITLRDYQGKAVMLDFWIWTCTGCREKMNIIQEAFSKMSKETTAILCIHVEGRTSAINSYAISEKLTVPILLDLEGTVAELYKITGFPTTFFIDNDGLIQAIDKEFSNTEELMDIFNTLPVNTPKPESMIPGTQKISAICCLSAKKQS